MVADPLHKHIVQLPYDEACEERSVYFNAKHVRVHRMVHIRLVIRGWLYQNIGAGKFSVGLATPNSVNFYFNTKENAALFKLFWWR